MDEETTAALEGAILKWDLVKEGLGGDMGASNCPLCALFIEGNCRRCPVFERTGKVGCEDTPFDDWLELSSWRGDCRNVEGVGVVPRSPEAYQVSAKMWDFLKSLRQGEKP